VAGELEKYLSSPDKIVAGLALWCFARLAVTASAAVREALSDDPATLLLFADDGPRFVTVGELARLAGG